MPINVRHDPDLSYQAIMQYLLSLASAAQQAAPQSRNTQPQQPAARPPRPQPQRATPQYNRAAAALPIAARPAAAQRPAPGRQAFFDSPALRDAMARRKAMSALQQADQGRVGYSRNLPGIQRAQNLAVLDGYGTFRPGQPAPTIPGAPPSMIDPAVSGNGDMEALLRQLLNDRDARKAPIGGGGRRQPANNRQAKYDRLAQMRHHAQNVANRREQQRKQLRSVYDLMWLVTPPAWPISNNL